MPMPRKPTPEKYCEVCGTKLERKRLPSGQLESLFHFGRRKYCNQRCMAKGFTGRWKENVLEVEGRYRARTITEKTQCERCPNTANLDVHHRDGDPLNNDPSNLEVLCRSCHIRHHRKRFCSLPNCGRRHKGHGYCDKHYQRWIKWGDPRAVKHNQHTPLSLED